MTPARAFAKRLPHVGVGSWMPAWMKESEASKTMASATRTVAKTMIGATLLRATCLTRIQGARAPETTTALT